MHAEEIQEEDLSHSPSPSLSNACLRRQTHIHTEFTSLSVPESFEGGKIFLQKERECPSKPSLETEGDSMCVSEGLPIRQGRYPRSSRVQLESEPLKRKIFLGGALETPVGVLDEKVTVKNSTISKSFYN